MSGHIAFHASGGLAMQILENPNDIRLSTEDRLQMQRTCATWDTWKAKPVNEFIQDDSGI